jgi:ATP-dependent Lon protease
MPDQPAPEELKVVKIPDVLPILPLFNILVFPKMMFPMEIFGDSAMTLVDEAMARDRLIGLVMSKKSAQEAPQSPEDFHAIGTSCVILKMAKISDNKAQLLVQGISRLRITSFVEGKPYIQARIDTLEDDDIKDIEVEALMSNLVHLFDRIVKLSPFLPQEFGAMAKSIAHPGVLADMIASLINAQTEEKQRILETLNVKKRLQEATTLVNHQVEILELGSKIQSQVKSDMDKSQREYYLRQQLKAIQQELGEADESKVEIDEYREKIERGNLPEEARKEAMRELERLARMHPSSAEYTVASTYLDWITALPWHNSTEDNLDTKKARKVLDEDHYGLDKAKKRIVEYLAVRKLKPDTKGPLLCFAGPPRNGKNLTGSFHRPCVGPEVYPHCPGRRPGRGGNPRASPHLHRGAAGSHHPGPPARGIQQSRFHAG